MGIRGLTSFLNGTKCAITIVNIATFQHDKVNTILIDGNSLIFYLIAEYKLQLRTAISGGSYWIFEQVAFEWLSKLQSISQMKIELFCDGAKESTKENVYNQRKLDRSTKIFMLSQSFKNNQSPSKNDFIARLNIGFYIACLTFVCSQLNILICGCKAEADIEIARHVLQKKYFACLSNDSDFFCLQVPFIPLQSLKFNTSILSAKLYEASNVAAELGLPNVNLLPYLLYVCNNKQFPNIFTAIKFLSHCDDLSTIAMTDNYDVNKHYDPNLQKPLFGLSHEIHYFSLTHIFKTNLPNVIDVSLQKFDQAQYDIACKFYPLRSKILSLALGANIPIEQTLQTTEGTLVLKTVTKNVPRMVTDMQRFLWILDETKCLTNFQILCIRAFGRIEELSLEEELAIYLHFYPQFYNNRAMSTSIAERRNWSVYNSIPKTRTMHLVSMFEIFISLCVDANIVCNYVFGNILQKPSNLFDAERLIDELEGSYPPECLDLHF